jgi:hypothetical protein
MTSNIVFTTFILALFIGTGAKASANDGSDRLAAPSKSFPRYASGTAARFRFASSTRICRTDEDTLRVLRLTAFDGGVRVDYEFVVSGRATWTNMNRPLLRQFGIRAAGTFCLPRDARMADENEYD